MHGLSSREWHIPPASKEGHSSEANVHKQMRIDKGAIVGYLPNMESPTGDGVVYEQVHKMSVHTPR